MNDSQQLWQCRTPSCGCIYDPGRGDRRGKVAKGTAFQDLPEDWKCPVCGAGKRMFRAMGSSGCESNGAEAGN